MIPSEPLPMDVSRTRRVLVAGIPRSGSTWVYNAARMILSANGQRVSASWCADYDPASPGEVHVIKAHKPEEISFIPDLVLTSRRDIVDCLCSCVRMGWCAPDRDAMRSLGAFNLHLYGYWHAQSAYEAEYRRIVSDPVVVAADIAETLGTALTHDALVSIADDLTRLEAPGGDQYDPVTLLHPGHRAASPPPIDPELIEDLRAEFAYFDRR